MRGMTGYGRATRTAQDISLECTISCYNKKSLDLVLKLAPIFSEFENVLRKLISSSFVRGAVTVSLRAVEDSLTQSSSLKKRFDYVKQAAENFQLQVSDSDLFHALFHDSELFSYRTAEIKASFLPVIESLVLEAIGMADTARIKEGNCVQQDFLARKKTLEMILSKIETKTQDVVQQQIEKLRVLLSKYVEAPLSNDERLLREVVLFADKVDITEEIVRIKHHLAHVEEALYEEGPVGKKIDFLFQELLREFSTLGAKTSNADVSFLVIQAKTELDKLREQVQNVE